MCICVPYIGFLYRELVTISLYGQGVIITACLLHRIPHQLPVLLLQPNLRRTCRHNHCCLKIWSRCRWQCAGLNCWQLNR